LDHGDKCYWRLKNETFQYSTLNWTMVTSVIGG